MENSTKMLGGISYIVLLVFSIFGAFVPLAGIISLAAAILILIAFIQAGNQVGRPDVKSDIVTAVVLYIVSVIVFAITAGTAIGAFVSGHLSLGAGAIVGGLIGWVLAIVSTWFWYKASTSLAEGSGVPLFKTGGLLLFIGAILIVVFGIGYLIMLIGEILQAVAFFSAPERRAAPTETV